MDCHVLTAVAAVLGSTGLSGSQPVLPGFLNSLSSPLEHFGLWAILLLVLVEDFGIPVPGETVLIAGAIFAGSGRLNVVAVAVVGFVAAVVGDNIGYAIGRFGGRALVDRWGKYVFLTPERLDKAEAFFDRHGAKIITIARFIEGLRQANGIIAGITHMHWLRFIAFNALGAALWVGTWVSVGYFAGQHITTIYNAITTYSLYAAIAAVVAIAAFVVYRLRKRRRSAATAAQAKAAAAAGPTSAAADEQARTTETTETTEATEASEATGASQATDKARLPPGAAGAEPRASRPLPSSLNRHGPAHDGSDPDTLEPSAVDLAPPASRQDHDGEPPRAAVG
jgi:membrane protein DedA with SNARE-associated domain